MSKGLFDALYQARTPFALIDTRERRDHVDGHWFGSTNIPLSCLSRSITGLVPDREFAIHLLDWQDSASAAAAALLARLGYRNVTIHPTTRPSGYGGGFVKGEYVWSKAFGEVVAHGVDFPEVTPEDYMRDHQGALLFDVRPTAEYRQFTIPASRSLPNSLLLANLAALKRLGGTALLHCAGRTRSIIGACTLKAAGYDGDFAVFRGGTQAWQLAGYEREHDASRLFVTGHDDAGHDGAGNDGAGEVGRFLDRRQIPCNALSADLLADFAASHDDHLMFDVSDDAATGQALCHGITRISGTNLIQQTDRSIARYHVPVVLFDRGSASRAAFAAFWLGAMGFEVKIVRLDAAVPEASGANPETLPAAGIPALSAGQLVERRQQQAVLIDLRPSPAYAARHLAGSEWRNISAMLNAAPDSGPDNGPDSGPDNGPDNGPVTLVCETRAAAEEAADMLARQGWRIDGFYGWQDGGLPPELLRSAAIDRPVDQSALFAGRHHGNLQDSRDYLAWEEELPGQIDRAVHDLWHRNILAALS